MVPVQLTGVRVQHELLRLMGDGRSIRFPGCQRRAKACDRVGRDHFAGDGLGSGNCVRHIGFGLGKFLRPHRAAGLDGHEVGGRAGCCQCERVSHRRSVPLIVAAFPAAATAARDRGHPSAAASSQKCKGHANSCEPRPSNCPYRRLNHPDALPHPDGLSPHISYPVHPKDQFADNNPAARKAKAEDDRELIEVHNKPPHGRVHRVYS